MNTLKKLQLSVCTLGMSLVLGTGCTNDSPNQDSKEHAQEINNENLDRDAEKDADRLIKLQTANLFEIQASQSAAKKASTADVKKLAAMMAETHTKMGADMQDLAIRKNITLPADMTNEQKRDLENLNEKTGLDFDKEYAKQMENKHEDAVKTLEKISDKSEDAEFRQWADQSIPEIRSHLDMVKSTKENIKDMKDDARASGAKNGKTKNRTSNDY